MKATNTVQVFLVFPYAYECLLKHATFPFLLAAPDRSSPVRRGAISNYLTFLLITGSLLSATS